MCQHRDKPMGSLGCSFVQRCLCACFTRGACEAAGWKKKTDNETNTGVYVVQDPGRFVFQDCGLFVQDPGLSVLLEMHKEERFAH